jgi:hypothetical protein
LWLGLNLSSPLNFLPVLLSKTLVLAWVLIFSLLLLLTSVGLWFHYQLARSADHGITVTVLLQNNHEVRASGGFIGSLAEFRLLPADQTPFLTDFKPSLTITFYDVYDLAGQVQKPLSAPKAVSHYLTAGQDMNLPDANWYADFPTAANHIAQLLSQVKDPHIVNHQPDLLIALNLDLIQQMLVLIGPIRIPAGQITPEEQVVTAHNLPQLARANRSHFFPGDKQKKQFLSAVFTQLKLKLASLSLKQWRQLISLVLASLNQQETLLYAPNQRLQTIFTTLDWAGELQLGHERMLYWLESNVGINKANQAIERQVWFADPAAPSPLLKVKFINHNQPLTPEQSQAITSNPHLLQADHLGYVNYQRVLMSPQVKIKQVSCSHQSVTIEEDRLITNVQGQVFRQVGFLLTVPEQSQLSCQIKLDGSALKTEVKPGRQSAWQVKFQPGIKQSAP